MLTQLLLAPLAPVRGVAWVAQRLTDVAERELAAQEQARVRGRLAELGDALDRGELSEEDYLAAEQELIDRLFELRTGQPPAQAEEV